MIDTQFMNEMEYFMDKTTKIIEQQTSALILIANELKSLKED